MIAGKCKDCLGCNRLEDYRFIGTNECDNYIKNMMYVNEILAKLNIKLGGYKNEN